MRVLKFSSVDYVAYFNTISVILAFGRINPGAKLKGGYGGGGVTNPPPPTPDFAGHRGSLQGKNVKFDMQK